MEALRYSLLAPSFSTFLLVMGAVSAVKEQVKYRYMAKDEKGNKLLSHPYSPWEPVDPKYKEMTDKAWRAFKMCENVKEWACFSLPLVWIVSFFGGSLPYVEEIYVQGFVLATSIIYSYATHKYMTGYLESPESRIGGFMLRMKMFQLWLAGSGVSLVWFFLHGVVGIAK